MSAPRAVICHERFLPRFGADRVLLLIGEHLAAAGWEVTFLGRNFDRTLLGHFATEIVEIPCPSAYPQFDLETRVWLERDWLPGRRFDLVVVGGWPFFSSIPAFRQVSDRVLFIDCGVVPVDGYPPATQAVLRGLVDLRREHLRHCTHIAANSRFTLESQTLPDAGEGPVCAAVLNGIDHLPPPDTNSQVPAGAAIDLVRRLIDEGRKLMLNLGRFETAGYKNSAAALDLVGCVRRAEPAVALLVLDRGEDCRPPPHLRHSVYSLGAPDDGQLAWIMKQTVLGVSVSLWEGFNLPIAEMYRIGRPALCFNLAAHPEVVADPWFLCHDLEEMAAKSAVLLCGRSTRGRLDEAAVAAYRQRFTWAQFMHEILTLTQLSAT